MSISLQLHVHIINLILCHLQKLLFLPKGLNSIGNKLHVEFKDNPLNHIECCTQLLANLSNYASIKLHFKNWSFIHQLIMIVILISFQLVFYSCKYERCVCVYVCLCVFVCVCVWCVCECYFCEHRSNLSENKKCKNDVCRFDICHQMAPLRMLHFVIWPTFKVKYFMC